MVLWCHACTPSCSERWGHTYSFVAVHPGRDISIQHHPGPSIHADGIWGCGEECHWASTPKCILRQSIWHYLCLEGQRALCLEDANFSIHVKMMTCMSFLPVDEITAGFKALQESPDYDPQMDVIFDCLRTIMSAGSSATVTIVHHCLQSTCGSPSSTWRRGCTMYQ